MRDGNPFYPDKPVDPEYFTGRLREVQRLVDLMKYALRPDVTNAFIVGERGIGKTSLAVVAKHIAQAGDQVLLEGARFLVAQCFLGPCRSTADVCASVVERLYTVARDVLPTERVKELLGRYVDGATIFGVTVKLKRERTALENLPREFANIVTQLGREIRGKFSGIVVILDELDSLAQESSEFAQFLKSTYDMLATQDNKRVPLILVLVGLPETLSRICEFHPSLERVFNVILLNVLDEGESEELIRKALVRVGTRITKDALQTIVFLGSGFPALLQTIGYWAYEVDTDGKITRQDLRTAITGDANHIGILDDLERRHFKRMYLGAIKSNTYREILRVMAKEDEDIVTLREIREKVKKKDQVSSYIRVMVKRGIIIREKKGRAGQYRFPNRLFKLYVRLSAYADEGRR